MGFDGVERVFEGNGGETSTESSGRWR